MTETTKAQSIHLPCPNCGATEAAIAVRLDLIGEEHVDTFTCYECDNVFSISHVRTFVRRWAKVLQWIDSAPHFADDE